MRVSEMIKRNYEQEQAILRSDLQRAICSVDNNQGAHVLGAVLALCRYGERFGQTDPASLAYRAARHDLAVEVLEMLSAYSPAIATAATAAAAKPLIPDEYTVRE